VRLIAHLGTRMHALVYRAAGGRVLGRMGGQPVLLLETIGRRSGRRRTTPLQYLPHDSGVTVVASARGAPRPPAWFLNLRAKPRARVRVGTRVIEVSAREAGGQEREALWHDLTAANRWLGGAARKAGRELPVVVLEPSGRPA
jgi:F420H(2)-dependent quinone reductase